MSLSLTIGPLTADEISKAITALASVGIGANAPQPVEPAPHDPPKVSVAPPAKPVSAMPPMPGNGGAPVPVAAPPAPPPAAPAPASNAKLETVLKLMDAYSRAGHQVAGARKVLALLGLNRVQDADEAQLDWLASAFSNTGWAP